jgi:hypothetical protein
MINIQGALKDSRGNLILEDATLMFFIFNAPTGGTEIWRSVPKSLTSSDKGIFNFIIPQDSDPPLPSFSANNYYLEIAYGIGGGSLSRLPVRQRIVSVPFAFNSGTANFVQGVNESSIGNAVKVENTNINNDYSAILGITNSTNSLGGVDAVAGVAGRSSSSVACGIKGANTGGGVGVYGIGSIGGSFEGDPARRDFFGDGTGVVGCGVKGSGGIGVEGVGIKDPIVAGGKSYGVVGKGSVGVYASGETSGLIVHGERSGGVFTCGDTNSSVRNWNNSIYNDANKPVGVLTAKTQSGSGLAAISGFGGVGCGVYGTSHSPTHGAVGAYNNSTGPGVWGHSEGGGVGVKGTSAGFGGIGVYGSSIAAGDIKSPFKVKTFFITGNIPVGETTVVLDFEKDPVDDRIYSVIASAGFYDGSGYIMHPVPPGDIRIFHRRGRITVGITNHPYTSPDSVFPATPFDRPGSRNVLTGMIYYGAGPY